MLLGYFIGAINPTYIIARIKGFDIREKGSRNAGASNALINFGKLAGILCGAFDIFKATGAILLAQMLMPDFAYAFAVTATMCIVGHIFPFYMGFKGGKGTSCLAGMVLAFDWRVFLIMLVIEVVLVLIIDYLCFMPITASVAFPIIYGIMRSDLIGALIIGVSTVVILIKNIENITRIKNGCEMHLSYLWNKDKETERMKNATDGKYE